MRQGVIVRYGGNSETGNHWQITCVIVRQVCTSCTQKIFTFSFQNTINCSYRNKERKCCSHCHLNEMNEDSQNQTIKHRNSTNFQHMYYQCVTLYWAQRARRFCLFVLAKANSEAVGQFKGFLTYMG